jgi:hypothetical protein
MIRHCVMFTWKPEITQQHKDDFAAALKELSMSLPGIVAYRCGPDAGINEGNHDFAVVADFRGRDDYLRYRDDAFHKSIVAKYVTNKIDARAAVQLEI